MNFLCNLLIKISKLRMKGEKEISRGIFLIFILFLINLKEGVNGVNFTLDGKVNCVEVPANTTQILQIALQITNLDPKILYQLTPISGAIMYWPGNSEQNYEHYAWVISITPDNCGMGTPTQSATCGSSSQYTCCTYTTGKLGSPPPLLHYDNATAVFQQVSDNRLYISGQDTLWVWFEDDNCSNNQGNVQFDISSFV